MDLAFVDKLAKQNNGVKYLSVAVDVFFTICHSQTWKTKYAEDLFHAFKKIVLRKTLLKNFELIKEQNMENFQVILQRERH